MRIRVTMQAHKILFNCEPPRYGSTPMENPAKECVRKASRACVWCCISQSNQNERELQVAIKLSQEYVKQCFDAHNIVILTDYMAQVNLTKRALALTTVRFTA